MWNRGIQNCGTENVLVLNDDVIFHGNDFSKQIDKVFEAVSNVGVMTLNDSWSHFAITKKCMGTVGWFDERLLGIGQEDGDFAFRYEQVMGFPVTSCQFKSLLNVVDESADTSIVKNKANYSLYNDIFIEKKYVDSEDGIRGMFLTSKSKCLEELELYPAEIWLENSNKLLSCDDTTEIKSNIKELLGRSDD
jgi:hypothetical protein